MTDSEDPWANHVRNATPSPPVQTAPLAGPAPLVASPSFNEHSTSGADSVDLLGDAATTDAAAAQQTPRASTIRSAAGAPPSSARQEGADSALATTPTRASAALPDPLRADWSQPAPGASAPPVGNGQPSSSSNKATADPLRQSSQQASQEEQLSETVPRGGKLGSEVSDSARNAEGNSAGENPSGTGPRLQDQGGPGGSAVERRTDGEGEEGKEEAEEEEEEFVYPGQPEETQVQQGASEDPKSGQSDAAVTTASTAPIGGASSQSLADSAANVEPVQQPQQQQQQPVTTAVAAPPPRAPVDFGRLASLCSHGPLSSLSAFFDETLDAGATGSSFALANEPNPSSGLVPLHYAARFGQTEVARWLVEQKGALVEMEDREGETALHKAALAGKLPTLSFLLSAGASANAVDADGWTALHNACSRGYLDIARVLIESAGADVEAKGGRGGWTPLMNAASKGHLPIVRYLTSKYHVDPFARNAAGETAYDVAAATFEVFTCELLERYEAERWAALKFSDAAAQAARTSSGGVASQGAYNPLALHATIPVLLHENQRLDTRLATLAVHGGRPRWSGTSAGRLTKPDRRAPGTMPPGPLAPSRSRHVPMRREDMQLPIRKQPYKLTLPARGGLPLRRSDGRPVSATPRGAKRAGGSASTPANNEDDMSSTPTPESVLTSAAAAAGTSGNGADATEEPSHFWLSEWQVDVTHPQVDAEDGWQYAQSFDAPEERWTAVIPPPLARLLEGRGMGASVGRAMTGGVLPGPGQAGAGSGGLLSTLNGAAASALLNGGAAPGGGTAADQEAVATGWVRRRRWIRVLRRRLDIEFNDELEAAELALASATASGATGAHARLATGAAEGVAEAEEDARRECEALGAGADYVARAAALAGKGAAKGATPADSIGDGVGELRKRMARLDLAVAELRGAAFGDEDPERRARAEDLLKEYTVQLGQLRQAAGLEEGSEDGEDEDDEEFIYPNSYKDDGQSVITRIGAASTLGYGSRPGGPTRSVSGGGGTTAASVFGVNIAPSEVGTSAGVATRSADLAASSEFRVPTREVPNRHHGGGGGGGGSAAHKHGGGDGVAGRVADSSAGGVASGSRRLREHNLVPQWEADRDAGECRDCARKFTFFLRKHHCRRCGRIFCADCSMHRVQLSADELVIDPGVPEMLLHESLGPTRVCNACFAERQLPPSSTSGGVRGGGGAGALLQRLSLLRVDEESAAAGARDDGEASDAGMSDVSSRASELQECPVCNVTLSVLGGSAEQEAHVRDCLENGGGGSVQSGRYLVYRLGESPIVGRECIVCFETFEVGATIARLPCLCYYHKACLDSWFSRGRACPVHAREI